MDLIVCEKPSAARDFASALGAKWDNTEKIYRAPKAHIAVLRGHLLRLKGLRESNPIFEAKWDHAMLVHLPSFPNLYERSMYTFDPKDSELIQLLKKHFSNSLYDRIVNATDPGREGELLFWELYDYFGASTPVYRFWESEALSKEVVLRGLRNLKDQSFYAARRAAAYARQHSDWYVGMNLTVAYTAASGTFFSVGTVQTPTLALVVRRDETIENWKGAEYHEISAGFEGFTAKYRPEFPLIEDRAYSLDESAARAVLERLHGATNGVVQSIESKPISVQPPKLFSLTTLQIKANQKYGLSGDTTLQIAQKLYEEYKCLSYPRTDSEVIGESMTEQVEQIAGSLSAHYQIPFQHVHFTKRNVNNEKLTDHHALLPLKPIPETAKEVEKQVYQLVLERFFQALSEPGQDQRAKVQLDLSGEVFEASGRIQEIPGWRSLFTDEPDSEADEEPILPALFHLVEGQTIAVVEPPKSQAKKMEPPKRYTEAELYKSMKNIANSIEDKALREAMKHVEGRLGTPATQASIIELLIQRGYLQRKGKQLVSTIEGRRLIHTVSPELTNVVQRAKMEQLLNDFSNIDSIDAYMRDVRELIEQNVRFCFELNPDETLPAIDVECPTCKQFLVAKRFTYECQTCAVAIPRVWGEHRLTMTDVKRLLEGQMTEVHTFRSKDKSKTFRAQLRLDNGKVAYHFPSQEELSLGTCPVCSNGVMYPRGKVLACTKCTYVLYRTIAGKTLTDNQLKHLLANRKTTMIKGFHKKDKSTFDAALVLGTDGKVSFAKSR
ncbi:DNA topoisomerase (plasmid) [Alicyclobacillus acidoterrestris]|uniref:type IA DNA topoisomerase n=1 Tax=Alicyclobacillus acidoterrestris TaxID=1450 RepID=UPI003F53349A